MNDTKFWYQSTTIQGGIISGLMLLITVLKINIDNALVTSLVVDVFGVIGVVMTIYGRLKANSTIVSKTQLPPAQPLPNDQ